MVGQILFFRTYVIAQDRYWTMAILKTLSKNYTKTNVVQTEQTWLGKK